MLEYIFKRNTYDLIIWVILCTIVRESKSIIETLSMYLAIIILCIIIKVTSYYLYKMLEKIRGNND